MEENFGLGYIPADENRGWLENADILGLCLLLMSMPESETKKRAKETMFQSLADMLNKSE